MSLGEPKHLPSELVLAFFRGDTSREENAAIVRHLLTRCPLCQALSNHLFSEVFLERDEETVPIEAAAILAARGADELRAPALWSGLRGLESGSRLARVMSQSQYHNRPFWNFVLCEAKAQNHRDPEEGLQVAHLALEIAMLVPQAPESLDRDMQALSYFAVATSLRLLERYDETREALASAEAELSLGTGDTEIRAEFLRVSSAFHYDIGEFERAADLTTEAARIFAESGDSHGEALCLVRLSSILRYTNAESGYAVAVKALDMLGGDEYQEACAVNAMIDCLLALGKGAEALRQLNRHRQLLFGLTSPRHRMIVKFLSARIAKAVGYYAEAYRVLGDVVEGFLELGMHQEMALASLYMADILQARGRRKQALAIMQDAVGVFESLNLRNDAKAVLFLVLTELREGALTSALVRKAEDRVRRYWHVPPPPDIPFP